MPRFVVLIHDHPSLHWDLMLEKEAGLRTWRLERPPTERRSIAAESLAIHRLAYLDYEGPVGGNRGSVCRFDRGEYTLVEETVDRLEVDLKGTVLMGKAVLERKGPGGGWTFAFVLNC
jgi:hypothetical protein